MCTAKFSESELAEAQSLLYNFVKPSQRLQKRKGDDMKNKTMCDIIKWFHECDADDLPHCVCDNVNLLPSVDIHDIDVSLLMKEISLMRYENIQVQDTCQQVVNECAEAMDQLKRVVYHLWDGIKAIVGSSVDKMAKQQNKLETNCVKQITCVQDKILSALRDIHISRDIIESDVCDESASQSGGHFRTVQVPTVSADTQEHVSADHRSDDGTADDQQPGVICSDNANESDGNKDGQRLSDSVTAVKEPCNIVTGHVSGQHDESFPALESRVPSPGTSPFVQTVFPPASTMSSPGAVPMAARLVEHNTAVLTHVNGHSTPRGGGLRAATPVLSGIDMFISRLDPTTTEDQLIRHLQTRGFWHCAVETLVTKRDSYALFKVKIPVKKFKSFRMPSMWPEGVYVRKFYRAKSTTNNG